MIERILQRLYLLCGALAAVSIVLIAILVAANVLSRLFGVFVGGLTEGAGYAMAAAGSLGLAYTFGKGAHIRVDLVLNNLHGAAKTRVGQVAFLATTAMICYLAYYIARMVWISWGYGDRSTGSDGLPLWLPQLPVAFGFVVFAIALVHGAVNYLLTGQDPLPKDEHGILNRSEH